MEAARDQIAKILDPKFAPTGGNTGGMVIRLGLDPFSASPDALNTCWPDYIILP